MNARVGKIVPGADKPGKSVAASGEPALQSPESARRLPSRLLTLGNLLRRSGNLRYRREFGMTLAEVRILTYVGAQGTAAQHRIASHAGLDKTQISREVKSLLAQGLIARSTKSARGIELSAAGRELTARIEATAHLRAVELGSVLSPSDLVTFYSLLDKIAARALIVLGQEQSSSHDGE